MHEKSAAEASQGLSEPCGKQVWHKGSTDWNAAAAAADSGGTD